MSSEPKVEEIFSEMDTALTRLRSPKQNVEKVVAVTPERERIAMEAYERAVKAKEKEENIKRIEVRRAARIQKEKEEDLKNIIARPGNASDIVLREFERTLENLSKDKVNIPPPTIAKPNFGSTTTITGSTPSSVVRVPKTKAPKAKAKPRKKVVSRGVLLERVSSLRAQLKDCKEALKGKTK